MPTIHKSAITPYSIEEMYALVNDVASYPSFVPWCVDSDILLDTPDEMKAKLTFASGALKKSFTTLNRLQPHKMIEIRLIDGPFRHMEGFWRFEGVPAASSGASVHGSDVVASGVSATSPTTTTGLTTPTASTTPVTPTSDITSHTHAHTETSAQATEKTVMETSLVPYCQINLDLEFEFSTSWLAMFFGPVFNQVANTLVDVFVRRAEALYGARQIR